MSTFLIDTNVFSKIFAGDVAVKKLVEDRRSVIDATIYIECLQGSKPNAEKKKVKTYLDNFSLFFITPEISQCAIHLIDSYSNSHGLFLPDALIAATALENDLTLMTYNAADFKFIQGLKLQFPGV